MNNPLISVIMPAYNAGIYIEESIRSIIEQTYTNWELLVVDDGSLDNTKDAVNALIREDDRIKYVYQHNQRQGVARNNGIAHSKGKYLAFLDADDIWFSNKLALQLIAIAREKVDLVFADCEIFYDNYVKDNLYTTYGSGKGRITSANGLVTMLTRNYVPILTVLVTRTAVDSVSLFSSDKLIQNAEDYHLWLKLMLSGYAFYGMDEVLAAYRVHVKAVTGIDKSEVNWIIHAKYNILKLYPRYKIFLQNSIWETILLRINKDKNNEHLSNYIIENLYFFDLNIFYKYFSFLKSYRLIRAISFSFHLLYLGRKALQKIMKL